MISLGDKILDFIIDPFSVKKIANTINAKASMIQGDLLHSIKKTQQLSEALEVFENKYDRLRILDCVNKALDSSVPDMFWVKDVGGKYIMANKAIRENLLFCENPIGLTDRELAEAEIARVGKDRHTFGAICGNSDAEIIRLHGAKKFNEDGLIKGKYMMLQVHKNIVKDDSGEVIGIVGVGRDITYEVSVIKSILNHTKCDIAKEKLLDLLEFYKFDNRD